MGVPKIFCLFGDNIWKHVVLGECRQVVDEILKSGHKICRQDEMILVEFRLTL